MSSFRSPHDRHAEPPYASIAGWTPPRDHESGRQRPRPPRPYNDRPHRTRWQRVRRLLGSFFIIFVGVPALLLLLFYWSVEIPEPYEVRHNQNATITSADGDTVLADITPPEGNRKPIPLSDVPMPVRDAILSAEDRNFYDNPGFSPSGLMRAARDNLLGKDNAGGGSTITQQYVKNAFLGTERTVTRKMRELVVAGKMSRQWSKDEILSAYLNNIYYGRGAYGIAAAAEAYFAKTVPELTVAEGAVLAALVRSPSALAPENHRAELRQRWNYVLDGMVEMGALGPGGRDTTTFPEVIPLSELPDEDVAGQGPAGLIRDQVIQELHQAGISQDEIETGALKITTTIDDQAQQEAESATTDTMSGQPEQLRSASVSIDPRTGGVRAYYGGDDGYGYDYAHAPLQTGSAFKTFAVIAALERDIPLSRSFDSAPLPLDGELVRNVQNESCGVCSLSEAFKRSLNTSFYRLALSMPGGAEAIADAAHRAGIPNQIPGVDGPSLSENGGAPVPSIVLGTYSVRPIDMASAYATIAASGTYHQPYFVQRVETGDGRLLLDRGASENQVGKQVPPSEQRMSPEIAQRTTQAMRPIAEYSKHPLSGRPSAAKTGTTQLGDSGQNKDAWMVGFTPSLSTAVWVGAENTQAINTAGGAPIYGSGLPAEIWQESMNGALEDTPVEQFETPDKPDPSTSAPSRQPSGGPYDILNPPRQQQTPSEEPFIGQPPASRNTPTPAPQAPTEPETRPQAPPPPQQVEIFPGLSIPVPG